MSEYASTVYGVIEYNIISPRTQLAIANFIGNRNILDEHISRKCDRTAAYSLPSAYVNNLGIEFTPLTWTIFRRKRKPRCSSFFS